MKKASQKLNPLQFVLKIEKILAPLYLTVSLMNVSQLCHILAHSQNSQIKIKTSSTLQNEKSTTCHHAEESAQ